MIFHRKEACFLVLDPNTTLPEKDSNQAGFACYFARLTVLLRAPNTCRQHANGALRELCARKALHSPTTKLVLFV